MHDDDNDEDNNNNEDESIGEEELGKKNELTERPLTIGNLQEGLQPNSWTMTSFTEEKKNKSSASTRCDWSHFFYLVDPS